MATNVTACTKCGAKNRTGSQPARMPVCGRCRAALPWMVEATDGTFDQEIASSAPVLVDLWAPWCGPCRSMAPALEELARDLAGRLKVVKVNVDQNPATQGRFRVQGIPTLLLFEAGKVVETVVGAQSKAALTNLVKAYL